MLITQKNVSETPLELLDRLRQEKPELKDKTLSYAGRLDPMAEGEMLVLVGEKENKEHKRYFGFDKEYEATFLVGMTTDTGDTLGRTTQTQNCTIHSTVLKKEIDNLKNIQQQTYPWFSGKTVDGVKLFDHFKSGNTDIERPTLPVTIKESELLSFEKDSTENIHSYIQESISKVHGDFRQEKILQDWKHYFKDSPKELQTFTVRFLVTSGTFIRALTEEFSFPCTLFKLKRTKIHI